MLKGSGIGRGIEMSGGNSVNVFVGSLITSLASAVLLILEDFAGWYNYGYYLQR